ncbi:aminotransferase-like domain-containing protein [Neptunicoccus cionae]|uniref:GntR family transcriptional regulator n=1 Tax=Neptunicoccus cionae TaxID=2035344 RepID=A0A916VMF4_9RHOB|nr:PLP-dependent aminotransferase family protein [Amylibacter cionae]GGA05198.1 GntR family transcriptional regulator [Amylibacter cionae]
MGTIWPPDLETATGAKYLAVVHALREAIAAGELAPGCKLPTVRDLAWDLKITPGTVARAYRRATDDGLLEASVGRGTYVAQTRNTQRTPPPDSLHLGAAEEIMDLRGTKTPDLGQDGIIRAALTRIATEGTNDLANYPDPDRALGSAKAITAWLAHTGVHADPTDVAITYGAQNAMLIALQTVLAGPAPVIVCDELVFPGLRHAAYMLRAGIVSVERDAEGIIPDDLEQVCRKHGPQVLVSSFAVHSPTTQTTSLKRRVALSRIAAKYDLKIIDDDAFGIAAAELPSMYAIAPERVWHIGALSKSVATGLRIGYLVTPPGQGDAAHATVLSNCYGVSQVICDLAEELVTSGQAAHIRALMLEFIERRARMTANILGHWHLDWSPTVPFVWLNMPSGWRASALQRACEQQNILIRPADEFALFDGKAPNAARITFGAKLSDSEFETALTTIASILETPPSMNMA